VSEMRGKFYNYSFLILCLSLYLTGTCYAQTTKVEAKLQEYTIKIGEQTKLFLVVDQQANQRVVFPALLDTISSKVQIVSINKADTLVDQKDADHITVTQSYLITSFDAGTQILPAFKFITADGTLKSNALTLQVQTVKVDTTKAIYDIKQPIAVKYTFWDLLRDNWLTVAIVLAIIAAIIGLIIYLVKRPKRQDVVKVHKPAIPIHTVAVEKLNALKNRELWQQGQFKLYHSELTDIIREYLEQRYGVKTYEKTTEEILESPKIQGITPEYLGVLQQILLLADLAKFAKFNPLPHENVESMDNALAFVLKTKQDAHQAPGTKAEGGGANGAV
jgi:hypothetical protein